MDLMDGGEVFVFPESDELPHQPGLQENWQESFVITWYDLKHSIGGLIRVGHEPNYKGGGRSQIMFNILSPEGVYRRTGYLPLEPRHRPKNGAITGDDTLRYEFDGKIHWTYKDTDIEMKLDVAAFVPPVDIFRRAGNQSATEFLGAHVDAGCSVSGTLTVKGKTYNIKDAPAVRDHAWGPRSWAALLAHRWIVGTFDRENSFVAMSFLSSGSPLARFGWVIRGSKVILADKVDIMAKVGIDGGTNFGGTLKMTLVTGEIFEVKYDPFYPCLASFVSNTAFYDSLSRVTWGDKVGFGVFETSSNIQIGTLPPECYDGSYPPDSPSVWHEARVLLADH